jgi:uncharacterized protein with FMN-binding domain
MAKMNKKWVVLCTTAITAVYVAGYAATETQAYTLQPPPQSQVSSQPIVTQPNAAGPSSSPSTGGQSNQDQTQTPTPTKNPTPTPTASKYKSGTYTGMGSNRRGSIQVAVTIKNDKITDVEVSNFAMHYSESDIVNMPAEVLQIQSSQVTNVSGATYSTQAFSDAVQDALNQAMNG